MSKCTPEECEKLYTSMDKWKISMLAGFVFMVLSSPLAYDLLNKIVPVYGDTRYPGLFITTILFVIVTRVLMR